MKLTKKELLFIASDVILSFFTLYLSYLLRFSFEIPKEFFNSFYLIFFILTSLKILFLYKFHIYKVAWKFFSLVEAKIIFKAHIFAYAIFIIIFLIFEEKFLPFARSIIIIDFFLSIIFIGSFKVAKRAIIENSSKNNAIETLIIGTNSFAQSLIKEQKDFHIVSVIEDDPNLIGSYFANIEVKSLSEIEREIKKQKIKKAIITKTFPQSKLIKLQNLLYKNNVKDILIYTQKTQTIKELSVEDLLARYPKDLDSNQIEKFLKDKIVLVTGAGGSIGSQICKKCIKYGVKKLILIDHSEYNLYKITNELNSDITISKMQSVLQYDLLEKTFKQYKPQIVIHAAAYKHVYLCEKNITEAIYNNIIGTKNVIDLSIKYNVEKFVLISTDKAVRPTNVMGATKRVCELYATNVNSNNTDIVAVRFGNVLNSSGSVIPKFKEQIKNGGPVTVTDSRVTRYFMLISEACELVLQAASIGKGKEIFILDMGKPVKILDLAKKMIELSNKDIQIEFIGLKEGEKLYEELLINETDKKTQYDSIMVSKSTIYNIDKLNNDINELLKTDNKIEKLKEIVKEFEHN